jgi:hypothetical protein
MAAGDNKNLQDIFIYAIYKDTTAIAGVSFTGKPAVLQIVPLSKVKKMKKICFDFLFCMLLTNLFAQKETFGVINYAPPAGWKKDVTKDITSYSITNQINNSWCQIGIIRSTTSKGNIELDFNSEWQELIVRNYSPAEAPQPTEVREADGWKIKAGIAKFIFNKSEAIAMLTTMSGYGRSASIVATTNSQDYLKDIQALLSSVDLKKPEGTAQPPVTGNARDGASIIGTWGISASDQSSSRVNNGVMSYITRQYTFFANGTYRFISKAFDPFVDKILLGKEDGAYQIKGNHLLITPEKSVLEGWSKKDGADNWGKLLTTQNRTLENITYQFAKHYFSGTREWSLVLQADTPTQRDGPFSGGTAFSKAWIYGTPCNACYIKLPD